MPPHAKVDAKLLHEKLVFRIPVARDGDETIVMVHNVEKKRPIVEEARERWSLKIEGPQKPGIMHGLGPRSSLMATLS
eukprot:7000660-Prymnesium_polylepis.1